jgi:hypothetical protein
MRYTDIFILTKGVGCHHYSILVLQTKDTRPSNDWLPYTVNVDWGSCHFGYSSLCVFHSSLESVLQAMLGAMMCPVDIIGIVELELGVILFPNVHFEYANTYRATPVCR